MPTIAIVYVELDDELTDVLEKIAATTSNQLLLHIPARSLLLTSMVNIELMKKKAESADKELTIVTKDKVGRALAHKLGLPAFRDEEELQTYYTPGSTLDIRFSEEEAPEVREKKGWMNTFFHLLGLHEEEDGGSKYRVAMLHTSKKAFMTIVFFSCLVLFAVFFFALPDATVTIQPKLAYSPSVANITLSTEPTDVEKRQVEMKPFEVTYEQVIEYPATGEVFKGTNAEGKVTVYNAGREDRSIVANSRIESPSGLVYLTKKFVTVPRARDNTPGTVEVDVVAREKDDNDTTIGERGNIGPSTFFFPALNETSRKLLYAESKDGFTGGTTVIEHYVTAQDIEHANRNIVVDLENLAPEKLHEELTKLPLGSGGDYDIFQVHDKRFVQKKLVKVEMPSGLVGTKRDTFPVKGSMKTRAYYYDKDDVVSILESQLVNHQLTYTEELMGMDDKTLKFVNIFPPKNDVIKITASMNGLVRYSFEKDDQDLMEEIKMSIAGLDRNEATSILQNLPEVDGVEIHLSPMWQTTLPSMRENIHVVIQKEK